MKPLKLRVDARHEARKIALQALFEWSFHECNLLEVSKRIKSDMLPPACDDDLLQTILEGVEKLTNELDALISRCAPEWPIKQLPKVDLNILRIAIFELYFAKSVPPKVAIDEAVELAKEFSGESTSSFVNGALGTVIKLREKDLDADTALFIGEFQPLHRGHMRALREIVQRFPRVVIVISNSDSLKSYDHPLTLAERKEMIEDVLSSASFMEDQRIEDPTLEPVEAEFAIFELPNNHDDDIWFQDLVKLCPKFSVVYTLNDKIENIFSKNNYPVFRNKEYKIDECNSKEIRRRIAMGDQWNKLVPKKIERYLKQKRIIERIRGLLDMSS